jgi:hypothetical protein
MSDLSAWRLRQKGKSSKNKQDRLQGGGVRVTVSGTNMYLLSDLMAELDHPQAVKFMFNKQKLAILPAPDSDPNSYPLTGNNQVSVPWLGRELGLADVPQGKFEATRENGMMVIDFE